MVRSLYWRFVLLAAAGCVASAHAPPIYIPVPPLKVRDQAIVDSTDSRVLLRGVAFDALETAAPNPITYRLIRQRWNANTVRIPLRLSRWQAPEGGGFAYLDRAEAAVAAARREGLIVVLSVLDEAPASLPGPAIANFWVSIAGRFREDPGIVFSLYDEPTATLIPTATAGIRNATDWAFWRNGGILADGREAVGLQSLADAIRQAGAISQIIAAPGFHDRLGFQGFLDEHALADSNVMYEVHPSYAHEITDDERQANFGRLRAKYPVYAGLWAMPFGRDEPACRVLPADPVESAALLLQTLAWFDSNDISWTAAGFEPGVLLRDFDEFAPTDLPAEPLPCDSPPGTVSAGIGSTLLLWTTGDRLGFGSILPEFTASLAGGPPLDLSPGQLAGFYGQGLGPADGRTAQLDATGKLPVELGGVRMFFNGIPAPILLADSFQIHVQAPVEVAGQSSVEVQLYYRDVPSNRIRLGIVPAAPEPFSQRGSLTDALARNEDGSGNSVSNPAPRGSVVLLSATGSGLTSPPSTTGAPGPFPPVQSMEVIIGQRRCEVLYWRGSATDPGRQDVAVRIPAELTVSAAAQKFAVEFRAGSYVSRSGVVVWVR